MADDKSWTKEKIKARIDGQELDLSLCSISKVPVRSLQGFPKVSILDLSCNKIHVLPEQFTLLVNITQLDLSKNSLTELPADFGKLVRLKKLDVFSNHITTLPLSFRKLDALQWLDLKDNPIQELMPDVVGDCLKPTELKACAKRMLVYLNYLNDKQEREVAEKRRHDRHQQAEHDRAEEVENQRKRAEKKQRKQEFEEKRRQRWLQNQSTLDSSNSDVDSREKPVISQADSTSEMHHGSSGSWFGWFLKFLCLLSLLAAVAVGVARKYYPEEYAVYSREAAVAVEAAAAVADQHYRAVSAAVVAQCDAVVTKARPHVEAVVSQVRPHVEKARDALLKLWNTHA